MSLQLLLQLAIAGLLLFVGVCLGAKARPRLESPVILATRLAAITLAALLFLLFIAESVGLGPTVDAAYRWAAFRAERLVDSWGSLL